MERSQRWNVEWTSPNAWSALSATCWRRGFFGVCVCVLKGQTRQQRSICRMLLSRQGNSRRFRETRPRISHGSLGHCESAIKEVEKQMRTTLFQMCADYNCNSGKFLVELPRFSWMVRHAAWTLTRYALEADGQTSFFKLMSKDYHGEVAKFSGLVSYSCQAAKPGGTVERRSLGWKVGTI